MVRLTTLPSRRTPTDGLNDFLNKGTQYAWIRRRHGRSHGSGSEDAGQDCQGAGGNRCDGVAGESGGGAVKVVITGKHECKSVVIDPSVVDPEDVEMLQDLIQLAFNSAQTRLSEISEERMRKEVPLPPGMKLPF